MITNYIKYPNPAPSISGAATALLDGTDETVPVLVYTSTNNGQPTTRSGFPGIITPTEQVNAITTIILCNTGTVDLEDENVDKVIVNIHVVKKGDTATAANRVISNLTIPAAETVFFSEERLILDGGDQIWVGTSDADLLSITISSIPV
jgi:hypothetical protein